MSSIRFNSPRLVEVDECGYRGSFVAHMHALRRDGQPSFRASAALPVSVQ